MKPSDNLTYLLQHLSSVMSKQAEEALQTEVGIGLSQYRILMVLDWNPRVQQHSIAESLGQTEASVSRQIKLLVGKGLLMSNPDPQNRRKHISALTPRGMQVVEAAGEVLRRTTALDLTGLSELQITQLTEGLHRLHHKVCQPGKTGACDHALGL